MRAGAGPQVSQNASDLERGSEPRWGSEKGVIDVKGGICMGRVWSMLAGGRLLARLANHQKTVTSLAVAPSAGPAAAASPRLISGSLDAHVKVWWLAPYTHGDRATILASASAIPLPEMWGTGRALRRVVHSDDVENGC